MTLQVFSRIVFDHRRLVLANAIGLAVVMALLSLVLPAWYAARATILPPEEKGSEFSLLSAAIAQAPILANFASTGAPSEILVRILESRTVRERVAVENDLLKEYKAKDMEKAVAILGSRTGISVTPEGLISLQVVARDPAKAAAMANSYVDALDEFNREKRTTGAQRTRLFVEGRLEETRSELERTENALRLLELQHSTVQIEDQTKAAIDAASGLLSEIVNRQVRLGVLQQELTPSHPIILQLESELDRLQGQLDRMILAQASEDSTQLYVPLRSVPLVKMEMLRLARELELLNRLYALLAEQYEQARIQEARDLPTIQVLDHAVPPVRRAKPKRTLMALSGLGVGLVLGVVLAFAAEAGRKIASEAPGSGAPLGRDLGRVRGFLRSEFARPPSSEHRE